MGIPYMTPLVAEGFEVLQTTRNITFLLAEIQVLTVVLLFLILIALAMLLVTCNPDLDRERQALVTPVMKWSASWIMSSEGKRRFGFVGILAVLAGAGVAYLHYWAYLAETKEKNEDGEVMEDQVGVSEGKDVEHLKDGKAKQ
ncbi:hypothetical protein AC579_255 [Pseudocercospora musae]|uniref:Uncharacterized protein n=1 Tax=Pseudocercospora musae TaxID=113226 RepID=A0A139I0P1_9PEZI|nr:hypothetical protein AC579_255 [Pseudocercospora musae]